MHDKRRILILGGGYGGVWAGKILEKKFRKRDDVEITLVDKRPYHTLMTELHEVAGWRADPESVQVSFRKIFGARRIQCVSDTIERVDFEAKIARSSAHEYPFDYILLGTGAEPEFFGTPGVKDNSFTLWSFDDAIRIRQHLETIFENAAMETDPAIRRRLLTFVVAGAGFTGIEMAGELIEYRDIMCRKRFIDKAETRVIVIEALPNILPMLEEPLRIKAEKYLRKKGCELMIGTPIVGVEPGKVLVKGGDTVETATFIWTCGVKGSAFAGALGVPMGKRNRVETDAGLRLPERPFAYAVGDCAGLLVEDKPMSMIVESAHFSATAAARNIIADIDGGERHSFKPNYHGFMISIGGRYGVSNAGGMHTSGFIAIAMKHLVNMYYLFRIAGLNQVWEYFKHEFLDIKDGRSIVGGFLSYKTRGYWPLLLRLWLGVSWLFEGINKIGEGWLAFASGTKSSWMFSSGITQAGVKIVDSTSAATAEAATVASGTIAATSAASSAGAVAATSAATGTAAAAAAPDAFHAVWDLTKPILDPQAGIVLWFKKTFMDGLFSHLSYQFFQSMIVATEMGIGLILLGGFFTWFGAVASIGLCIVFTLSGMFRWDQLWFFFAAIAMMGGAGRVFGLDYWSVPFFKKGWNGTRFARRSHLYGDDPTK
jgi:NADH:ubiquinone reductase (H+-translocating)